MNKIISDQVDNQEIKIFLRELAKVITNGVEGDILEFGCYVGTTTIYLSKYLVGTNKKLFVYDSFEGLPAKTSEDMSPIGVQFHEGELKASKKQLIRNLKSANAPLPIIKKAWFADLKMFDLPKQASYVFLDGDYYASIKYPLTLIESIMSPGSTIIVDDYTNPALPGVAKAVDEWLANKKAKLQIECSLAIISLL
jgi:O-methyltransferase